MPEYIDRGTAIAKLTDLDIIKPNATMTDAKRLLADMPGAKAVSLHDIYRVIAGHSYYHGDRILAALSCIAEGKEVNLARPADVAPVVHGRWISFLDGDHIMPERYYRCSRCGRVESRRQPYCHCGAKMDGAE